MDKNKILVIGGGSWGTAFANYLAAFIYNKESETGVNIWIREKEIIHAIRETRENPVFLPGFRPRLNLKQQSFQAAPMEIC